MRAAAVSKESCCQQNEEVDKVFEEFDECHEGESKPKTNDSTDVGEETDHLK